MEKGKFAYFKRYRLMLKLGASYTFSIYRHFISLCLNKKYNRLLMVDIMDHLSLDDEAYSDG